MKYTKDLTKINQDLLPIDYSYKLIWISGKVYFIRLNEQDYSCFDEQGNCIDYSIETSEIAWYTTRHGRFIYYI